jgi:hypothetical protein
MRLDTRRLLRRALPLSRGSGIPRRAPAAGTRFPEAPALGGERSCGSVGPTTLAARPKRARVDAASRRSLLKPEAALRQMPVAGRCCVSFNSELRVAEPGAAAGASLR